MLWVIFCNRTQTELQNPPTPAAVPDATAMADMWARQWAIIISVSPPGRTDFWDGGMHRLLFSLAAAGFLAGSLSWVVGARRAYHRAVAVEHRGLQAAQWRSLAAKDGLAGALLLSLVPVLVAKTIQGRTSAADWFWLVAVVPLLASLAWIRRFHRLAGLIETEADYAQHQRERADQEAELASTVATRLGAENVETPGGILLRTVFHPAEGVVGGDFLGTATAGEAVWFVIGDVAGHGLEAAVKALRLKDLVLTAALAGLRLGDALALGNALLWADPSGEGLSSGWSSRASSRCYMSGSTRAGPSRSATMSPRSSSSCPPRGSLHPASGQTSAGLLSRA
jgi:Stage II sporulation protein E (SpoIIE)